MIVGKCVWLFHIKINVLMPSWQEMLVEINVNLCINYTYSDFAKMAEIAIKAVFTLQARAAMLYYPRTLT